MKHLFLLAFASLLASVATAQNIFTYPIGVQTYTFRKHFPNGIEKTLDEIKSLGFTEIEGNLPIGITADDYKKLCDTKGLSIPSTGAEFDELVKDPIAVVNRAKILGAKFVMCAWIPHARNEFTLENAKNAVQVFNAAGKILSENGLTLCYHEHGYEFYPYQDGTLLDYIIKSTDPKYVSFEMDVLWVMHGGGAEMPVSLLNKYPGRFKLMHLKDLKKGVQGNLSGGTPAENDVPVGMGQGNWKEIIRLAKKYGVVHCFIEDESNHEMENVPLSLSYLKSL
ncbi:MAG: sugar phosphate isomerase/epimerase [Chitinophagia bacterium]|jgi:sugar phosphate isomerase/epimerase|nr:sugar phosphate isomerase/epimerase [Chitinophagia bacterium]